MKTKLFLFFLMSINGINAQDLVLTGNAVVSIKSDGIPVSASGVKLKDFSLLKQAEGIHLTRSGFIVLDGNNAKLETRRLSTGEEVEISVGIDSKTIVKISNTGGPAAFSIGLEKLEETEAIPVAWKLASIKRSGVETSSFDFFWEKGAEPSPFSLRGIVHKVQNDWELVPGKIIETIASVLDYKGLGTETMFTIQTVRDDSDFDEVPDVVEFLDGTEANDPGTYTDIDGDGVPDYVEMVQGTDPTASDDFQDSNGDGNADYIIDRSPVVFMGLQDLTLPWGNENLIRTLPDSIMAITGSGTLITIPVVWDIQDIDFFRRGDYPTKGKLLLPNGIFNVHEMEPQVMVRILPKPMVDNIFLSNNSFDGSTESSVVEVGAFTVQDKIDNIHFIELYLNGYDNQYFKIKEGFLFWNSLERAEGKTVFTIIVRVTDRDGNSLDKTFEITRLRPSITEIEIYNTFSPNGDGINDTWGIPDTRFFQGVRIQVFERSGKRLFYTVNPDLRWDGTLNGEEIPIGTYYWTLEVKETGETRKGMLNLLKY